MENENPESKASAPPPPSRGAHVQGDVSTGGGDFVGRDKIIQIGALKLPLYLAVIIGICMISILGFVAYPSVKQRLPKPLAFSPAKPDETLIVIATFFVSAGNRDTLTHREIRNKIKEVAEASNESSLRVEIEPTVLAEYNIRKQFNLPLEQFLIRKAGQSFYNIAELDMGRLLADPNNIKPNLVAYIQGFSANARDIS